MASKSVVIIGGGVAGITAAAALSDAGFHVELIEKRPMLGGRATSFLDPQTGEPTDECQHGTMRCCTNLTKLLELLGVSDQIQYFDELHFLDSGGVRSVIKGSGLPAPLHTSFSFLMFRSLNIIDKMTIARGMMAMLRWKPSQQSDTFAMSDWFLQTGQTERAVKRFWRPILVSACNEEPELISCLYGFKLFRDGFLMNSEAFHFGIPRVPLGVLYTEPAVKFIRDRGGSVRLKTNVDAIEFDRGANGAITGVTLKDDEKITADYYVSALQFDLLMKMLPDEIVKGVSYWENLKQLELSPIAGIHIWFDRHLDCPPALALLDRETEWIFNKTQNFGLKGEGTYLSMVISASRRFSGMSKEDLLALVLKDVCECVPGVSEAKVVRSHVIRWPKATLSPKTGTDALRPDQYSPISNLYVAGEWTNTGWPSTMESAARSGFLAAEYILQREGIDKKLVADDLPVGSLARILRQ